MTSREAAAALRAWGLSYRLIGLELGISREGARQLLLPLPPRACRTCKGPLAGQYGRRYCRAPCLPPSEGRPSAAPRRKREEIAGPPRRRGRPRLHPVTPEPEPKKPRAKKGGGK